MSGDSNFKIRTVPRTNEIPKAGDRSKSLLIISMVSAILAIGAAGYYKSRAAKPAPPPLAKAKPAPVQRKGASVVPNMQDTRVAEMMMRRRIELENQRTMGSPSSGEGAIFLAEPDDGRTLGVQLDQENTAERIYEDLYGEKSTYADGTPEERINARLANRKWLNEVERAERLHFVKAFIRQAYDRGFEVELDQNLVVIGVKRIGAKKVNIDEVLNRLAKQGH